jgi:hypothetical protein
MRGLATYLLAGALAAVAMDISVSPGSAVGAWPQVEHADVIAPVAGQSVNRSSKGDRLDLKQTVVGKSQPIESAPPAKPAALPAGCEPAFSTLTASAAYAGNFVRGCIS